MWIDRSSDRSFSSDVWQLGLFMCSSTKCEHGHYKIKCLVCEQHKASFIRTLETNSMAYHAEHTHPKLPKVSEWLHKNDVNAEVARAQKAAQSSQLIQVCSHCSFFLVECDICILYIRNSSKGAWMDICDLCQELMLDHRLPVIRFTFGNFHPLSTKH